MEKILDKESKIAELHIYTVIYSMTLFIIQCILGIFSASTSWYLFFGITGIINCAVLIRVLSIYYGLNNSWKGSYRHWKTFIVCVILTVLFFVP